MSCSARAALCLSALEGGLHSGLLPRLLAGEGLMCFEGNSPSFIRSQRLCSAYDTESFPFGSSCVQLGTMTL